MIFIDIFQVTNSFLFIYRIIYVLKRLEVKLFNLQMLLKCFALVSAYVVIKRQCHNDGKFMELIMFFQMIAMNVFIGYILFGVKW